jgi:hypothetical protein
MRYDYYILGVIAIGILFGALLGFSTGIAIHIQEIAYDTPTNLFLWFIVIYGGGMSLVGTYLIVMCFLQEQFRHTQAEIWGQIPLK